MLESLITSGTRIKLLLKFFINPANKGYLRQIASEFGESTNSIRVELNKLTKAKILLSELSGRNIMYFANTGHPLYTDIRNIVLKSTGIDQVISNILNTLGKIDFAFVRGDYAAGIDSGLIDLVIVGEDINTRELERVKVKTEALIHRKISVLLLTGEEYENLKPMFEREPVLVLIHEAEEED